jgi:D-lactate dehydrogenase
MVTLQGLKPGRFRRRALIREEAQLLLDNVPRERLASMLRAHILLTFKNVIITPHCAFNSKESLERLINSTIENITTFIGGKPQNIVEVSLKEKLKP